MKTQSATYQQSGQRTDWSSEIKMPSGNARSASGTGLGGMERNPQTSNDWNRQTSGGRNMQTSGETSGGRNMQTSGETSGDWNQQTSGDWLYDSSGMGADSGEALSVADSASGVNRLGVRQGGSGQAEIQTRVRQDEAQERMREREAQERLREHEAQEGTGEISGPQVINGQEMNDIWPNIENNLSNDVIEAPTTMEEVYRGSMKALLLRNVGNYVVATFLIGTQTTVSWEGILYDVGNDYIAIYQSGRDQYIVSDLYSLKYVEFYDTRRRELCDSLLTAQEPMGNSQRN